MSCPCCIETTSTLLNFLEKVEQILKILNLSETVISKYNKLKELTFNRLHLQYTPLIKIKTLSEQNTIQLSEPSFKTLYMIYMKQQMLIDTMQDYITQQPEDIQPYLNQLSSIYSITQSSIKPSYIKEFDYDISAFDKKLKDEFCRFDEIIRNKQNNLLSITRNFEIQLKSTETQYEKQLYDLREKVEKNANIEKDLYSIRKQNDSNLYLINNLAQMIDIAFQKYSNVPSNYMETKEEHQIINKLKHLFKLIDNFYDDNKYMNNILPQLQKEKFEMNTELNLPYVNNVVQKNTLMQDLVMDISDVEKSSNTFHKNFQELINYIEKNIE